MLTVWHFISGDLWAGAEAMAYHLLKHLQQHEDLQIHALLFNEGRLSQELKGLGMDVVVLEEDRYGFPTLVREAHRRLRQHPPDIVHSHRFKENVLAFLSTRFLGNVGLVATQHGLPETSSAGGRRKINLTSLAHDFILSRFFDRVVGVSENVAQHLIVEKRVCSERVRVIHNGIELPKPAEPTGNSACVVGSAGRFFPVKDYGLMIDIAQEVTARGDALQFILAGDGPEREALEYRANKYRLNDRFRFCGHLDDMSGFYGNLGIYLNTSLHEGIPMSILEAMAHGLPVVAPQVGGIVEIIEDGVEGFLVEGRDPREYAEKCLLLQDPDLRHRMGCSAREKVQKFYSARYMARQYCQVYRESASF